MIVRRDGWACGGKIYPLGEEIPRHADLAAAQLRTGRLIPARNTAQRRL